MATEPASLRYRATRGIGGAAALIVALWVLREFVVTLPEAMDQAFWPFTWIVAFALFGWLLVR